MVLLWTALLLCAGVSAVHSQNLCEVGSVVSVPMKWLAVPAREASTIFVQDREASGLYPLYSVHKTNGARVISDGTPFPTSDKIHGIAAHPRGDWLWVMTENYRYGKYNTSSQTWEYKYGVGEGLARGHKGDKPVSVDREGAFAYAIFGLSIDLCNEVFVSKVDTSTLETIWEFPVHARDCNGPYDNFPGVVVTPDSTRMFYWNRVDEGFLRPDASKLELVNISTGNPALIGTYDNVQLGDCFVQDAVLPSNSLLILLCTRTETNELQSVRFFNITSDILVEINSRPLGVLLSSISISWTGHYMFQFKGLSESRLSVLDIRDPLNIIEVHSLDTSPDKTMTLHGVGEYSVVTAAENKIAWRDPCMDISTTAEELNSDSGGADTVLVVAVIVPIVVIALCVAIIAGLLIAFRWRHFSLGIPQNQWIIPYSDLIIGKKVSSGSSSIYAATWREAPCIVKEFNEKTHTQSEFDDLALLLSTLHPHPNVCSLFGFCNEEGHHCVVMELVPGGSLLKALQAERIVLSPEAVLCVAHDLASAMLHLHKEGVLHYNLTAENLLVYCKRQHEIAVKLSGFGVKRKNHDLIRWTAPEVLLKGVHSKAADVWAFGVVVWEIIECQVPYSGLSDEEVSQQVTQQGLLLSKPTKEMIEALWTIMQPCFHKDPEQRPTFQQITAQLDALEQGIRPPEVIPSPQEEQPPQSSSSGFYGNIPPGHMMRSIHVDIIQLPDPKDEYGVLVY